jgi:hemoglobin
MGEKGVFALLADLYAELEASPIRGMFPADMAAASRKSAAFFVQLLGGRPLYSERHGPPRMRQRHLPFEIDLAARGVWLACFERVLATAPARHGFPPAHLEAFRAFLRSFSGWMVNAV